MLKNIQEYDLLSQKLEIEGSMVFIQAIKRFHFRIR